jgi:hypothetical protein
MTTRKLIDAVMCSCSAVVALAVTSNAMAQAGASCDRINDPAPSSYSFTDNISRWGGTDTFDLDSGLELAAYEVRDVQINTLPIFDEANRRENNSLYRWINRAHMDTRPSVIANQILFRPGDKVNAQVLAETERLLRAQRYVGESEVRVLRKCGEQVELEVVTREVWTLLPEVTFHASGGDNSFGFGLRDSNILGSGQGVSLGYKSDADRDSYQLAFHNPNLGNTFRTLDMVTASNSDGHQLLLGYALPFYSLNSRTAWNVEFQSVQEILSQYQYGERVSELSRRAKTAELSRGFSKGLSDGYTQRFRYGLRVEQHNYSAGIDLPAPATRPVDVSMVYPFVEWESIEDNYIVAYNIRQIYRAEDLHIGKRILASIGYAPGDEGRIIMQGEYSDTLLSRPRLLLQLGTDYYARWNQRQSKLEDSIVHFALDFHRGQTENRSFFLGLSATRAFNLNNGRQVSLGGSSGLRGFDSHFLNGDGSVRVTAEQRIFTNYHILQLARLGFAGFVDAGRVFGQAENGAGRTFSNVGLGMRLAPSKSKEGKIIHIDIAYPLQVDQFGEKKLQFLIEAKATF